MLMWWLAFAGLAAAVLLTPRPSFLTARFRQVGLLPPHRRRLPAEWLPVRPRLSAAMVGVAMASLGAASGFAVAGRPSAAVLPALSTALLGAVGCHVVLVERAGRRGDREARAVGEALTCLADELRAGQRPGPALVAAGEAAGNAEIAGVFGRAAAAAALGDRVAAAFTEQATDLVEGSTACIGVQALAAAWQVSERAGAPLATVVDRVADDLRGRRRQREDVLTQLAGARATVLLLAALPAGGVLLATSTGAHPVQVLLGTTVGQVALLAGAVLDATGVTWCLHILTAASAEP
jgi:tight adherence protein B